MSDVKITAATWLGLKNERDQLRAEVERLRQQDAQWQIAADRGREEVERLRRDKKVVRVALLRAEIDRLRAQLAAVEADAERLREALYESWALNTNVFSTAEPELASYYSEHRKVIAIGKEALAAHDALVKGGK